MTAVRGLLTEDDERISERDNDGLHKFYCPDDNEQRTAHNFPTITLTAITLFTITTEMRHSNSGIR